MLNTMQDCYQAGYQLGLMEYTLPQLLALVSSTVGTLEDWQRDAIVAGWEHGSTEAKNNPAGGTIELTEDPIIVYG